MHSCASCAPAVFVAYCLGFSERYCEPKFFDTLSRAASIASCDSVTESVRI